MRTAWPALFLAILGADPASAAGLRIAVASSLVPIAETVAGSDVQITAAASGVLHAQITHGAQFDLLAVADPKYIDALENQSLISSNQRFCIAVASLALASAQVAAPSLALLARPIDEGRLAIADPKLAPFGRAALEVLQHFDRQNLWQPNLIMGRNAAQATQFVATRHARLGVLPALLADRHGLSYTTIPDKYHHPVVYEAALLSVDNPVARQWLEGLLARVRKSALPGLKPCD